MSFADMLDGESPQTVRLAENLSLAVLIEPALLRRARLELEPDLDAGVEADVWFSPFVASRGPDGIVLERTAAEGLRARLKGERLAAAWALLQDMHGHVSPALRIEEEIAWRLASEGEAALPKIKALLGSAIASLVGGERGGLAHWALQAVHRLPSEVLQLEEVAMLQTAAMLRTGGRIEQDAVPEWMEWMLPGHLTARHAVKVSMFPGVLEFERTTIDPSSPAPDIIQVPRIEPLQLDVQVGATHHTVTIEAGPPARVAIGSGRVQVRLSDGTIYDLTPTTDLEAHWRREIISFSALDEQYRQDVVPPELLQEVTKVSGAGATFVRITGMHGSGKTALLASLARSSALTQAADVVAGVGPRAVAAHFFSDRTHEWRDRTLAWQSLAAQLERRFPTLRHVSASPLDRLRDLLTRLPDSGPPALVILDGIDELDARAEVLADVQSLFAAGVPGNVALVAATAERLLEAATVAEIRVEERRWLAGRLRKAAGAGIDTRALEDAGGNMLAARFVIRESGHRAPPETDDVVSPAVASAWSQLSVPAQRVLGVVAAAREPLTWWRITEAAGFASPQDVSVDAESLGAWLVHGKTPDFEDTFAVVHEHVRVLIARHRGDSSAVEDHAGLLKTVANWTPQDRGEFQKEYSLRYALHHAAGARDLEQIERLATNFDFLEARCRLDPPRTLVAEIERLRARDLTTATVRAVNQALAAALPVVTEEPASIRFVVDAAFRNTRLDVPVQGRRPRLRLRHPLSAPGGGDPEHRDAVRGCSRKGIDEFVSWSADSTLKVWRSPKFELVHTITGHVGEVMGCQATADFIVSGGRDCAVRLWRRGERDARLLLLHEAHVLGVLYDERLQRVISWDGNGAIHLTGLSGESRQLGSHAAAVTACVLAPEGLISGAADHSVRLWDVVNGGTPRVFDGHAGAITTVAFNAAYSAVMSAAEDGTIRVWHMAGAVRSILAGHDSGVLHFVLTDDGQIAVSCSRDQTLRVWDISTGRAMATLEGHTGAVFGCRFLPDGRLVSWSADRTLRVWDIRDARTLHVLEGHSAAVNSAIPLDDGTVVSCSDDRSILRWKVGEWPHP